MLASVATLIDHTDPTVNEGLTFVKSISECSQAELMETICRLRAQGHLTRKVCALNRLLSDPLHRADALRTLRRMGLEYSG